MNLTTKQTQILDTILKGNPDGSWLDFEQLIKKLPYATTKDSLQFSIRALVAKNLIEKKDTELRRGYERRIFAPTALTYDVRRRD